MAKFYHDDLRFVIEEFIDWQKIWKLKGSTEDQKDTYSLILQTFDDFCAEKVDPFAAQLDHE
jgi:hypothetical protein